MSKIRSEAGPPFEVPSAFFRQELILYMRWDLRFLQRAYHKKGVIFLIFQISKRLFVANVVSEMSGVCSEVGSPLGCRTDDGANERAK